MNSTAEIVCDCDHETKFDYKIPGTLTPVVHHAKCEGCASLYTFRFVKMPNGTVRFTMSLSFPSRKLANILAQKELKKKLNAPQKKAPQFFLS